MHGDNNLSILLEVFILRAGYPVLGSDAALELFELRIHAVNVFFRPLRNLFEPMDAERVQQLLEHGTNAVNQLQLVVRSAVRFALFTRGFRDVRTFFSLLTTTFFAGLFSSLLIRTRRRPISLSFLRTVV
jgi:hypothetical protein